MKRRRVRLLLPLVGLGVLGFVVAARAQPPSGIVHPHARPGESQLELGSQLYAANCLSCHGVGGIGVPAPRSAGAGGIEAMGPSLRGVGALAPDFYLRTGRMPLGEAGEEPERHRPYFNEREIRSLTAYVASFGKGPAIPHPNPERASLSEGMQLFTEHCAGCHQVVGEGGYVTDAKVPVLQHASSTQIAEAVRIGPYLMPRFSPKAISDRELNAIIAYVQASKDPVDRGGLGIGHIGPVPEGIVAWLVAAVVLVGVCVLIGERLRT
jgi:ubiquinol-cytochrome c reductase cytochrome c subunit